MNAPGITTDAYGNRYAAVPVAELDDGRGCSAGSRTGSATSDRDRRGLGRVRRAGRDPPRPDHLRAQPLDLRMRALAEATTTTPRRRR